VGAGRPDQSGRLTQPTSLYRTRGGSIAGVSTPSMSRGPRGAEAPLPHRITSRVIDDPDRRRASHPRRPCRHRGRPSARPRRALMAGTTSSSRTAPAPTAARSGDCRVRCGPPVARRPLHHLPGVERLGDCTTWCSSRPRGRGGCSFPGPRSGIGDSSALGCDHLDTAP
jgi:hypothetical protein